MDPEVRPGILACIGVDDNVVTLADGNVDDGCCVWFDRDKVRAHNREIVMINPESRVGRGAGIDKAHLVGTPSLEVKCRNVGSANALRV